MLASFDTQFTYDIVTRSEIKNVNDLKGKKFGISSLGGTHGWRPSWRLNVSVSTRRDRIQVVAMANQTSRFHALEPVSAQPTRDVTPSALNWNASESCGIITAGADRRAYW